MAKSKASIKQLRNSPMIPFDDVYQVYVRLFPIMKEIITEANEESVSETLLTENFAGILSDPLNDEELVNEEKIVIIKFLRLVLRFICLENVEKQVFLDIIDQVIPLFNYMQQIDADIKADFDRIIHLIKENPNHKISNDSLTVKKVEMEEWKLLSFMMYAWILKGIIGKSYGAQRKYFASGNFAEYSPTLVILVLKYLADRKMISNQQNQEWSSNKNEQSLIVTIIGFLTDYHIIFVRNPPSSIEKEVRNYVLPQLHKVYPKLLTYLYEISEPPFECIKISNFFTIICVNTIEFIGKKALRQLRSLMQRDYLEVKHLYHTETIGEGHNCGTVSWIIKLKILNMLYALVQFTEGMDQGQFLALSEYLPMAVDILNVETYHSNDIESMLQNFSLTTCFAIVAMARVLQNEETSQESLAHFLLIFSNMPRLLDFSIKAWSIGSCALQIVCCDTIKVITLLNQSVSRDHFEKILSFYHHDMENITPYREMLSVAILYSDDKHLCYDFFMKLFNQIRGMSVTDEKFYRGVLLTISLIFDMYQTIIDKNNLNIELLEFVKEKINELLTPLENGIKTETELNLLNSFSRIIVVQHASLNKIDGMKQVLTKLIVSIMNSDLKSLEPMKNHDTELTLITNNSAGNLMMLLGKLNVVGYLHNDENGQEFIGKVVVPKLISYITKPLEEFRNAIEAEKTVWAFNTVLIYDIGKSNTLVEKLRELIPQLTESIDKFETDDSSFYYEGLIKTFLLLFNFYPEEIAQVLARHVVKLFNCFNNSFDDIYLSLYASLVFRVIDYFLDTKYILDFSLWLTFTHHFYEAFKVALNLPALTLAKRVLCRLGTEMVVLEQF